MSELLKVNVNDHTEQKNGLTYLSWAWAWAEVLKVDPLARFEVRTFREDKQPVCWIGDSAMVCVEVIIKGICRECWLPVMDNRNKAIKSPDAFAINTAIQRCMVKAIALHGLGLYIYAGEDLPEMDIEGLTAFAAEIVQLHEEEKNTAEAVRQWYANEHVRTSNEAREFLWGQLRDYSSLRSAIKANNPHQLKEAA